VWVARDAALWFVDIKEHRIHRFSPEDGALDSWPAPSQVCWVLPIEGGGMVAGLEHGIHRFDPASGAFTLVQSVEPEGSSLRLNDAAADKTGAIWLGTMDNGEKACRGHVYRYAEGKLTDSGLDTVVITNGPAVSPDGRILYPVDTIGKKIWAAVINDDGTLGARRVLAEIEEGAGHPDGAITDAEGFIWVGLYGGWGVRRYAPDGRLAAEVKLPVSNVTKIAFGGDDLRTAYATTARKDLDAAALAAQPLAGNLFAFDPGVAGLPCPLVKLGG